MCKLYEKLIRNHILDHVFNQISPRQHGFVQGKSCLSNLLEAVDKINELLSLGENVDIFYLDFQKAFDTVPHYRLLTKLKSFGISDKTLLTIADFLKDRSFQVNVGNNASQNFKVTSGVPQGSVLGPLLFLLYINDLPENIKNLVSLFADDLKMYGRSSEKEMNQTDLNKLENWQNDWLLFFNTKDSKCKVMHVGKSNPCNQYYLQGYLLPAVETEKDLGITISNSWKWDQHILNSVGKANGNKAWVIRSVISRSPDVLVPLYKSMIRSHLEYCVQVWSPLPKFGNWGLILELENVQRSFTRLIDGIGLLPYNARLEKLNLTTLLERRVRGDLIETFKILSGIANYGEHFFTISRSGTKLVARPGDEKTHKHAFFARRIIPYWNKLPIDVKNATNVNQFKNKLDSYRSANINSGLSGQFWNISEEIFSRIRSENREEYELYMKNNPHVAKIKGVNTKP